MMKRVCVNALLRSSKNNSSSLVNTFSAALIYKRNLSSFSSMTCVTKEKSLENGKIRANFMGISSSNFPAVVSKRSYSAATAAAAAAVSVFVPPMGDSITSGNVVAWLKNPGDAVQMDEIIMQIETDKITVDVRAPVAGVLTKVVVPVGNVVGIKDILAEITPGATPSASAPQKATAAPIAPIAPAAPAAPAHVAPAHVAAAPVAKPASPAPVATTPTPNVTVPVFSGERVVKKVPMTTMRKRIAERLKESQNIKASLTTFQEVDMHNLKVLRDNHKDAFEKKYGVKLGFMSAFIAASTLALQEIPAVNASIDNANNIIYNEFTDISVAVATPKGLVTPVIRNTHRMSFGDIEKAMGALGKKAKDNQITMEDLTGGTFTISNGGVFGSLFGTPIINGDQSAILGMHNIVEKAWVVNGKIEVRPIMVLALTYDHRIIDGREAVTFLKSIKQYIEDPARMLLRC